MQRIATVPRPDWQKIVEGQGFQFHTPGGQPYWDEAAYYLFSRAEIDEIERATYALNEMCLAAVDHVIEEGLFDRFQISPPFADYVRQSWDRDEVTIYGRFDLAFDGNTPPKLLEYNADTPTSLLEAAVIQWFWFQEQFPPSDVRKYDQFNSIHERLIEAWKTLRDHLSPAPNSPLPTLYFSALQGALEDFMTVNYLRDTAMQAGWETKYIDVETIGWNWDYRRFVDERENTMRLIFKLYPWEWMLREAFAPRLLDARNATLWLEAPWKMILSNKAILPVLWKLFPESPYLLAASYDALPASVPQVRKPMLGREGANVQIIRDGRIEMGTPGDYQGPYVYQQLHPLPDFGGRFPVIGSWMVNGYASGVGIREDQTPVTTDASRFLPHLFVA